MKLSPLSPPPTPGESDDSDAEQRTRLTDSLTQSYPGATLSHALSVMNKDVDDPLSRSCYAELRLEKIKKEELDDEDDDDDLTNLAWLQDSDLLKNIKTGDRSICTSPPPEDVKENSLQHPPHVPYNPQKHVNTKPPYSFSCLIFMAIEDSPDKRLPVKDIYNWILTHFPYFQNAPTGWKNSVRHNLSLNKCFKKVDKDKGSSIGKGSLWMIDPDFRPNLLQALRKTPYHPYHQLQMFNNSPATPTNVLLPGAPRVVPFTTKVTNINSPSPHLFPFLSRRLAQSNGVGSTPAPATLESDIDVANTLVSLKRAAENRRPLKLRNTNGARSRSPSPPEFGSEREKEILKRNQLVSQKLAVLCTSAPCEDHTYSISAETLLNGNDPRELMDSTEGSDGEEEMDEEVDEDEVSDEETEAVYRAAIQRIKLDALAATAAIPTITARIVSERKRTQDTDRDADSKRAADALLNLAAGLTPHNNNNNNNIDGLEKLLQVAELSEGLAQMKHENNNEEENMDQS